MCPVRLIDAGEKDQDFGSYGKEAGGPVEVAVGAVRCHGELMCARLLGEFPHRHSSFIIQHRHHHLTRPR